MVRFIDVDPAELPNFREGHRGRVSYPILKSFMETGKVLVMLDRTGIQQSLQSLQSSLTAYIRSHNLPIKLFTRGGQVYLLRLDTDTSGEAAPANLDTYQPPAEEPDVMEDIAPVTPDVVAAKFPKERLAATK